MRGATTGNRAGKGGEQGEIRFEESKQGEGRERGGFGEDEQRPGRGGGVRRRKGSGAAGELFGMFKGGEMPEGAPLMDFRDGTRCKVWTTGASDSLPGKRNRWGCRRMETREEGGKE